MSRLTVHMTHEEGAFIGAALVAYWKAGNIADDDDRLLLVWMFSGDEEVAAAIEQRKQGVVVR